MRVIEGELLELPPLGGGQSAKRVNEIWADVRAGFEEKAASITLDKLVARGVEEMYYI